jgi:23S rRNA (uridine2552-2'-O)-methyltransferase
MSDTKGLRLLHTGPYRLKLLREWLRRQANDPYVRAAQEAGYRVRSAFKVLEMDKTCGILRPGMTVVECGAAPGAWTQVACNTVTRRGGGVVIGCDLLDIEHVDGARLLPFSDLTAKSTQEGIVKLVVIKRVLAISLRKN